MQIARLVAGCAMPSERRRLAPDVLHQHGGGTQRSTLPWERGRLAPDVLHLLCEGAHGEETAPGPCGPPLLRALATLVEGGSADDVAAR